MTDGIHSTGRGGAGNIGVDTENVYTDGGIVREGLQGHSNMPDYSTGRGGAGNIVEESPRHGTPVSHHNHPVVAEDVVPETNLRDAAAGQENFHTGRGGEGNVHKEKYGGHTHSQEKEGTAEKIGDKVKHLLGMDKKA